MMVDGEEEERDREEESVHTLDSPPPSSLAHRLQPHAFLEAHPSVSPPRRPSCRQGGSSRTGDSRNDVDVVKVTKQYNDARAAED